MIKKWFLASTLMMISATIDAHDMFLVLDDHFVEADSPVTVSLYNGTFERSENTIDRDRMLDVSVVSGEGQVQHPTADRWRDQGHVTELDGTVGAGGTYLVGVSTAPRMIELAAEDFNDYLQHDGVLDVLEQRRREGALEESAREKYSKHIKTILQVAETFTAGFAHRLGYPVEIVPLSNPLAASQGDSLEFLVLAEGKPVAGQLVYASYAGFRAHDEEGTHGEAVTTRTDDSGIARIEISHPGRWYIRLIRMLPSDEEGVDYESNWATLTFEVR
jgi:uncharacterized GH25 family protein